MRRTLSCLLVFASACEGTDILDHTIDAASLESDAPPGVDTDADAAVGPSVDGPAASISVAALGMEIPDFLDVAWESSTRCGANGIYLAASGGPLDGCAGPLSSEIAKPYLQIQLSDRSAETYDGNEGDCPGTGPRFFATLDAAGESTSDASGGAVTIDSLAGDVLSGTFEIFFPQGILLGSFAAPRCGG